MKIMIDSVVFQLDNEQFKLKDNNKLDGRKTHQGKGFQINSAYCEEYKRQLKKKGIYCPDIKNAVKTVGLESRKILEIQASLSKLLNGTNLFEIDFYNTPRIRKKLLFRLDDLGIITSERELKQAVIRRADFSKIIELPTYLGEANTVVYALSRFDYKPSSHFNFNRFNDGNSGTSIKFWNTTQGYVIYDVLGNILSNGYTIAEKKIIEDFKSGRIKRNLIKFELSLERKDSFEAVIRRRIENKKRDFYLEDILNRDLARDILLKAFDTVFNKVALGLISLSEMEDNKLRAYLEGSEISINKQEKLYYWVRMATKNGIAGTWEQIKLKYKGGSVARCKKEIALILQELGKIDGNIPNLIEFLRNEHLKFESIKPTVEKQPCQLLLNNI